MISEARSELRRKVRPDIDFFKGDFYGGENNVWWWWGVVGGTNKRVSDVGARFSFDEPGHESASLGVLRCVVHRHAPV